MILVAVVVRLYIVRSSGDRIGTAGNAMSADLKKGSGFLRDMHSLLEQGKKAQAIQTMEGIISSKAGSERAYESIMLLTEIYQKDGNLLTAKDYYKKALNEYPDYCDYADIQDRLGKVNVAIIFSKIATPESELYEVKQGDSLAKIAKSYATTIGLIKKANGLDTDIIKPGMRLKVQKVPFSLIVDKSQSILTLLLNDEVIKTYKVSTGKNNSTPIGTYQIKNKLVDPVWYATNAIVPPESPENVLGTRWLGLTTQEPGYGIHGNNDPASIGYQCTEGCVRMYNEEVEELFDIIPVGAEIVIID